MMIPLTAITTFLTTELVFAAFGVRASSPSPSPSPRRKARSTRVVAAR